MRMKYFYFGGLMAVMAACQEQALPLETEKEMMPMRLEASIAQDASSARTVVNSDNGVSFSENDCIGLFVPWEATARKWTYSGSSWTSESSVYWKDKTGNYTFYAYYPCGSQPAASYTAVPMPDLSSQAGTLEGLADYDFLVASTTTSYSSNSGTLSFTGENAFQHVLSRISFIFDKSSMDEAVQLIYIRLNSDVLSADNTCNLTTKEIASTANSQHAIISAIVNDQSEMLVNPINNATITLSVVYQIDSEQVTVSKEISSFTLQKGSRNTMNVKVEQGTLSISNAEIASWGAGEAFENVTL